MRIYRMYDNWNKVSSKEELLKLLNNYSGILNKGIINYLKSLINLEFSVIKDYISDTERISLSELEIYKKIAIYNIYNKAISLFSEDDKIVVSGNNDGLERLTIYKTLSEKRIKLFDFNYSEGNNSFKERIPKGYRTTRIGNVTLFKSIDNADKREAELTRVMNILDKLYEEENPYSYNSNVYGGPAANWSYNHCQKIKEYEELFKELDEKKELSEDEKKEIEITSKYNELLLNDFGLTNNDFNTQNEFGNRSELNKKYIKTLPNLTIVNNIKYL